MPLLRSPAFGIESQAFCKESSLKPTLAFPYNAPLSTSGPLPGRDTFLIERLSSSYRFGELKNSSGH